jgi:DNA-binding response OmpR family regulator
MTLKILFLEKDVTTADLLVPGLERQGYQVTLAHGQRQATTRIRSLSPDLLILDVASFGNAGYRLCDTIRARLDGVPTILLLEKGHANPGNAEACILPPFTSRKLIHKVKKVAEHLTDSELRAGQLALDPRTRTLRTGAATFHLRPKEVDLLALFMRNLGKVLTRQELMRRIWQTEYMGDTRTLSVHIRWLREKIEENPNSPRLLRTIRGVGYRFDVPDCPVG